MPRPRKEQSSAEAGQRHASKAGIEPPFVPGSDPPSMRCPTVEPMVEGKFNVEWFAQVMAALNEYAVAYWNWWGMTWPDYREQVDTIIRQAGACGVDLSRYAPEQMSVTDLKRLDDVFEMTDERITLMEKQVASAASRALKIVPDAKKNFWLSVLRRLRRLKSLCRDSIPEPVVEANPGRDDVFEAWELVRVLRFMTWCWRTTIGSRTGEESLPLIPDHLIHAAVNMALARKLRMAGHPIGGVVIVIPPRHGKSVLACADEAMCLSEDPWNPRFIVHRKQEIAVQRVDEVKKWFSIDQPIGRRRRALFPRVEMDARRSKASSNLWLTLDGRSVATHREGNLTAYGLHAGAQGVTAVEIKFDDPVDEKDRHEAGTRERTNAAFYHTWLNRLTGSTSFFTLIATCWHPDDVTGSLIQMVRSGIVRAAVVNIPCGGPDDGFAPLWPEAGYDARYLRSKFLMLRPAAYSCIYQNNPDSIEGRRIANMHFFDERFILQPELRTPEWHDFLEDRKAIRFLSIDPSGTDTKTSNRAGIGYFQVGMFGHTDEDGVVRLSPRMAMLRAWSIHASQHALVDEVMWFKAAGNRIDRCYVEVTGGYHATAEELVRQGIPSDIVWRITPGTGTKIERLMRYAIHIENGDLMFPGRWTTDDHGDPVLEAHQDFHEVAEQLLRAGTTTDDEQIDVVRMALSQHSTEFDEAREAGAARARSIRSDDPIRAAMARMFSRMSDERPRSRSTIPSFAEIAFGARA